MTRTIFVARASFVCDLDGESVHVPRGATVRDGHPLLEGREDLFGPLTVDFEHHETRKPAAAKHAKAD
jgi:hypothetical protein